MYSPVTQKYLRNVDPFIAQMLKRFMAYPRYYTLLRKGRLKSRKYGRLYNQKIFFIAGLPKSGTTWLENLLSDFDGITPIVPRHVTSYEMKNKGSCEYDFPAKMFDPLKEGLFLIKMHSHGSRHNIRMLMDYNIRYCIIYRDLRDIAVSYYFYVSRTPWHPENQIYRRLNIKDGLMHFCDTRLDEYSGWIKSWRANRMPEDSLEVTFEEMLRDPVDTLKRVARLFELDDSEATIEQIIKRYDFAKMRRKSEGKGNFFRKGISGDWKNHFDEEIKREFRNKCGELLIELGYEDGLDW